MNVIGLLFSRRFSDDVCDFGFVCDDCCDCVSFFDNCVYMFYVYFSCDDSCCYGVISDFYVIYNGCVSNYGCVSDYCFSSYCNYCDC